MWNKITCTVFTFLILPGFSKTFHHQPLSTIVSKENEKKSPDKFQVLQVHFLDEEYMVVVMSH